MKKISNKYNTIRLAGNKVKSHGFLRTSVVSAFVPLLLGLPAWVHAESTVGTFSSVVTIQGPVNQTATGSNVQQNLNVGSAENSKANSFSSVVTTGAITQTGQNGAQQFINVGGMNNSKANKFDANVTVGRIEQVGNSGERQELDIGSVTNSTVSGTASTRVDVAKGVKQTGSGEIVLGAVKNSNVGQFESNLRVNEVVGNNIRMGSVVSQERYANNGWHLGVEPLGAHQSMPIVINSSAYSGNADLLVNKASINSLEKTDPNNISPGNFILDAIVGDDASVADFVREAVNLDERLEAAAQRCASGVDGGCVELALGSVVDSLWTVQDGLVTIHSLTRRQAVNVLKTAPKEAKLIKLKFDKLIRQKTEIVGEERDFMEMSAKIKALIVKRDSKNDGLIKTMSDRKSGLTADFRKAAIERFTNYANKYAKPLVRKEKESEKDFAGREVARLKSHQNRLAQINLIRNADIDHKHELQLGGKDSPSNFIILHPSINRSSGSQIYHQTKKDEFGTKYGGE